MNEGILIEDKQVKFGGEVNPKYGWCVFYAGGPASGKSSSEAFNIPIVGKKMDADEFKSVNIENKDTDIIEPGFVQKFAGGKYYDKILHNKLINGDESKMTIKNPDYVRAAHEELDKFIDKVKGFMRKDPLYYSGRLTKDKKDKGRMVDLSKSVNPERLPNIIFDQTSKNVEKLANNIHDAKSKGYKIAIVWVLTDIEKNMAAFKQRNATGRQMDPSQFLDIHPKVFNAMISVFDKPELLNEIDDFWVVINQYKPQKTAKQRLKQIRDTNVYNIELVPDGLKKEKPVWKLIQKSLNDLDFYSRLNPPKEKKEKK